MESLSAALAIGIAAFGGAISIGIIVAYAFTSIARQPEITGRIRPLVFVGIAFVEATVLYALVVALIILGGRSGDDAKHAVPSEANTPAAITTTATNY